MGRVRIRVSPAARRTELLGRHGAGWKARVAAQPERGRANAAVEALLATALSVPRRGVRVVAGHTSRDKVVEVEGLDAAEIEARLSEASRGRGPQDR
jgi:uncharacterized protein YggU (UPF0235/DUF167 family)